MGGDISVESEPGRGSTFTFTARFGRRAGEGEAARSQHSSLLPAAAAASNGARWRILVAEDNQFNADLVQLLLKRHGHAVRIVETGQDALEVLERESFDLLLLDIHMPVVDGFQAIERIRARERENGGHLPVIALTARSRKEDRDRCLAAGMDDFLAKPIRAGTLADLIARVMSGRRGATPSGESGRASVLDASALLAACGEDCGILERVVMKLRDQVPVVLATVQDASRRADPDALRDAAHKLHGMIAAVSSAAGTLASEIEDDAANGALGAASQRLARLVPMTGDVLAQLDGLSIDQLRQIRDRVSVETAR